MIRRRTETIPEGHNGLARRWLSHPQAEGIGCCLSSKPPNSDKICMCHNPDQDPHAPQSLPGPPAPPSSLFALAVAAEVGEGRYDELL